MVHVRLHIDMHMHTSTSFLSLSLSNVLSQIKKNSRRKDQKKESSQPPLLLFFFPASFVVTKQKDPRPFSCTPDAMNIKRLPHSSFLPLLAFAYQRKSNRKIFQMMRLNTGQQPPPRTRDKLDRHLDFIHCRGFTHSSVNNRLLDSQFLCVREPTRLVEIADLRLACGSCTRGEEDDVSVGEVEVFV